MGDDSRTMAAILTGAVLGGLAGYLFFTERGREIRQQLEPAVEDFARELSGFRGTIQKAIGVATQSWDIADDTGRGIH